MGTIFEDSPLPVGSPLCGCSPTRISSELARASALPRKLRGLLHRIREAMRSGSLEKLSGEVEVDETYVGGRIQNMHPDKRRRFVKAKGRTNKVPVIGLLQRTKIPLRSTQRSWGGRGKGTYCPLTRTWKRGLRLSPGIRLAAGWCAQSYRAISYVEGCVHTGIRPVRTRARGYRSFHLMRYLDEQAFRFNEVIDGGAPVIGRRVTYSQLTGGYLKQASRKIRTPGRGRTAGTNQRSGRRLERTRVLLKTPSSR